MPGKLGKVLSIANTKHLLGRLSLNTSTNVVEVNAVNKSTEDAVVKVYLASSDNLGEISTMQQIDQLSLAPNAVGARTCKIASAGEYVWVESSVSNVAIRVDALDFNEDNDIEPDVETYPNILKLLSPDGASADRYGFCIGITDDGSRCVVGAPYEKVSGNSHGVVYVYRNENNVWVQEQKLISMLAYTGELLFGYSVCIDYDGDTIAIGAQGYDHTGNNAVNHGIIFVYVRSGNTWTEQASMQSTSPTPANSRRLGRAIALGANGNRIVSVSGEGFLNQLCVFDRVGNVWTNTFSDTNFTSNELLYPRPADITITRDGKIFAFGTLGRQIGGNSVSNNGGSVFVYRSVSGNGGDFTRVQKIDNPNPLDYNSFGTGLSITDDGRFLLIGNTIIQDPNPAVAVGGFYIYHNPTPLTADIYSQVVGLTKLPNPTNLERFGFSSTMLPSGEVFAVSAYTKMVNQNTMGAVYVYTFNTTTFEIESLATFLQPSSVAPSVGEFGVSLKMTIDGKTMLIGSQSDLNESGVPTGSVYTLKF